VSLQCEHPGCAAAAKDYHRLDEDLGPDAEGPLDASEKAEWLNEPIALCDGHKGAREEFDAL
jgi:hypothetical protein